MPQMLGWVTQKFEVGGLITVHADTSLVLLFLALFDPFTANFYRYLSCVCEVQLRLCLTLSFDLRSSCISTGHELLVCAIFSKSHLQLFHFFQKQRI